MRETTSERDNLCERESHRVRGRARAQSGGVREKSTQVSQRDNEQTSERDNYRVREGDNTWSARKSE